MLLHTYCICYCIQTVYVAAYKLYMLLHTNCICYCMQTVYVAAYKLYMLLHKNCTCYCIQTVHVTAYKLCMLLHTKRLFDNILSNCLVIKKRCFKHLHPNMVVCYLYIGVWPCFNYVLGNWLGFCFDIAHYNFSHLKIMGNSFRLAFSRRTSDFSGIDYRR